MTERKRDPSDPTTDPASSLGRADDGPDPSDELTSTDQTALGGEIEDELLEAEEDVADTEDAEAEAEALAEAEAEEAEAAAGTTGAAGAAGAAGRRFRRPTRAAAAAPSASELAVRVRDRASAVFVLASGATFVGILAYGLLFGAGGALSTTAEPILTDPPLASPSGAVSASPSGSPDASPSGSGSPSPSGSPSASPSGSPASASPSLSPSPTPTPAAS